MFNTGCVLRNDNNVLFIFQNNDNLMEILDPFCSASNNSNGLCFLCGNKFQPLIFVKNFALFRP